MCFSADVWHYLSPNTHCIHIDLCHNADSVWKLPSRWVLHKAAHQQHHTAPPKRCLKSSAHVGGNMTGLFKYLCRCINFGKPIFSAEHSSSFCHFALSQLQPKEKGKDGPLLKWSIFFNISAYISLATPSCKGFWEMESHVYLKVQGKRACVSFFSPFWMMGR